MTANVKPPAYQWAVTSTRPDTNLGPGGQPVSGLTVTFNVVDPPLSGTVFIPDNRKGDLGFVKSEIMAEVGKLAGVANLTSES